MIVAVGPVHIYPSVILVGVPENVRIHGLPGTI